MKLVNHEVGWDNGKPVLGKVVLNYSEEELVEDLTELAFSEMAEMTRGGSGDDQAYVDSALEQLHAQVNYSSLVKIVYKLLKRDCLLNTTEDERRKELQKASDRYREETAHCMDLYMKIQDDRYDREQKMMEEGYKDGLKASKTALKPDEPTCIECGKERANYGGYCLNKNMGLAREGGRKDGIREAAEKITIKVVEQPKPVHVHTIQPVVSGETILNFTRLVDDLVAGADPYPDSYTWSRDALAALEFKIENEVRDKLCMLFALNHAPCDNSRCVCQTALFDDYWKGAGIERRTTNKNEIIAEWLESGEARKSIFEAATKNRNIMIGDTPEKILGEMAVKLREKKVQ